MYFRTFQKLYTNNIKIFKRRMHRNYSTADNLNQDSGASWRKGVVGAQPFQNLKVGPYKRGKWFVSFKDDPGSFVTNMLILAITIYTLFTLSPGESILTRRRRKIRQEILEEYGLTESELEQIEDYKLPPSE